MKHQFLWGILCAFLFLGVSPITFAQTSDVFEARAGDAQDVLVGDIVSFDGSASVVPSNAPVSYTWSFGDGIEDTGARTVHIYKRPGTYMVHLSLFSNGQTTEDSTSVRVYKAENLILTDEEIPSRELTDVIDRAADENVFASVVGPQSGGNTLAEGIARYALDTGEDRLQHANVILVWAQGSTGTDILATLGQLVSQLPPERKRLLHLETKGVVLVTDQSYTLMNRPAQTAFNVLRPQYVLLVRPEDAAGLMTTTSADGASSAIRESGASFSLLGTHSERAVSRLTIFNALSYVVNILVNAGVPASSITLILMLPVVATLLAFSRQVIGVKAFGMFTPAAVTLSFLAIGLKYGLLVFAAVLFSATVSRLLLRRFRLLYLPRMAIVLTAVSFAILVLFWAAVLLHETRILAFSVFPTLLLASLAEQFVDAQIRLGFRTAARLTVETLILSVLATIIVQWETFRSLLLGFPELIFLSVPFNILLGRWAGLRVTEYIRFWKLLTSPGR